MGVKYREVALGQAGKSVRMIEFLTGDVALSKGEAAQVAGGAGGVCSSDDLAPDLWFEVQRTVDRRDATSFAEVKSSEERGDGRIRRPAPENVLNVQIALNWKARRVFGRRNSESRMRENRRFDSMRSAKQTVIGTRASQSVASRLLYPLLRKSSQSFTAC